MSNDTVQLVNVTRESLSNFLLKAKERIIFVKPAFNKWEMEHILSVKEKGGQCELYLETGDQAIRFGFGDIEALTIINNNIGNLPIQTADRIRLAILIVDNQTLVYVPEIVYLDNEDIESSFPNGFLGDHGFTDQVLKKFPSYKTLDEDSNLSEIDTPFETGIIEQKHKQQVSSEIKQSIKELQETPPVDPLKLKKVYYYRNKYKIVKTEIHGVKIKNKRISLTPFYRQLEQVDERVVNSWNIFNEKDIKELEDISNFVKEVNNIIDKYLLDAGRFGYLMEVSKKKIFLDEIEKVEKEFTNFLKGEKGKDNRFARTPEQLDIFSLDTQQKDSLSTKLSKSRGDLVNHLIKEANNDKNFINNLMQKDRHTRNLIENNKITEGEALREFIEKFIDNKLKFPIEQELIERIKVKADFYDISDELIDSNDFKAILSKHGLMDENKIRDYAEGRESL
jgi:hypothetical protein